ncbi:MAG: hypothetical protein WC719_02470 [Patescibacteria group bacterium]|jgi:hypothetical protein
MFNSFAINKIERGCSSPENTGTRLESEFIGEVDGVKYKELAYDFLHKENEVKAISSENQFERRMMIKEAAQKEFENALDLADKHKYIDYKNSVKLVEQSQLGNPERPSRFFSGALYKKVKERFEDKYILKFFTATGGTHLDVVHGVDGFFKLYDKENGQELAMATIDLTGNSNKNTARADVLISVGQYDREKYDPSQNNENFDKNFFDEKIEKFSEMITQALIENYQNR